MALCLASYNIHACIGTDGRRDPERVRAVLREMDADIIALQEVEVLRDAPQLLPFLCEGSRWQPFSGPTMHRSSGEYGNAVLSRLPVRGLERIDLSQPDCEPRGALRLSLDYWPEGGEAGLELYATHLGLSPDERRRQIRLLLAQMVEREGLETRAGLSVLMGDLNEWFLWGRPLRWLRRHFATVPAPATFPSWWPLLSLDRIWAKPHTRLRGLRVWKSPLSRRASDHLPLLAYLD